MVAVHFAANGEFKGDFTIVNPTKIDPSKTQKLGAVDLSLQTMGVASAYDSVFEFNDINGDGEYTVGTDTKGREIRLGQIGWKEISDTIVTTGVSVSREGRREREKVGRQTSGQTVQVHPTHHSRVTKLYTKPLVRYRMRRW